MRLRPTLIFLVGMVAATATGQTNVPGQLTARPPDSPSLAAPPAGKTSSIGNGAYLYVPSGLQPGRPTPLLLLFPGTDGSGPSMISTLRPYADKNQFIVMGFTPTRGNFETIDNFFDDLDAKRASATALWPAPRFGPDVRRVDQALSRVFAMVPVDKSRIGLFGFSHGGSYALTLGTANPQLFGYIQALSPGVLIFNPVKNSGQSVFLSHGTLDEVQPYRRTACSFVPRLVEFGYGVTFAPFVGGHVLPSKVIDRAIAHFLEARLRTVVGSATPRKIDIPGCPTPK